MRIHEEYKPGSYSTEPGLWVSGADATPQKIYEELFSRMGGSGYVMAIVIDISRDEYETPPRVTPVYYLDELFDLMCDYIGTDRLSDYLSRHRLERRD